MDKILNLFTQPLACTEDYYRAMRLALFTAMRNGTLAEFESEIGKNLPKCEIAVANSETLAVQIAEDYELTDPDLPENSIAVITVEGGIYPYISYRVEQLVKTANANPNINGILFFVNTPGGYVHRVDITSEVIAMSEKPTAVYATGMCCSGGMFMFCGAGRIFAASELDRFGSIGTMTTFSDDRKFWEENGFVDTDIYATLSTKKNYNIREAEKGNFEPIRDSLDIINQAFHQAISTRRGITIDPESDVFNGSDFMASRAIELGLVDEIADFDTVLNWVVMEGMKWKAYSMTTGNS